MENQDKLAEAKKLLEEEANKRVNLFGEELKVILEKYGVELIPFVEQNGKSVEVSQILKGNIGLLINLKSTK